MIFSLIKTLEQFQAEIATIDDVHDLNEVREVVRKFNRGHHLHALRNPKTGFRDVFLALDDRAEALGFLKYDFGYRDPNPKKR